MYLFKKFAFWLGVFALILILAYIFISPYSSLYSHIWIKTLLAVCNAPLYLLLRLLRLDIFPSAPAGIIDKIPFCLVYVASFIGYGILVDFIFNKLKIKRLIKKPSVRAIFGWSLIAVNSVLLACFILIGLKYTGEALDTHSVRFRIDIAFYCFWPAIFLFIQGIHLIVIKPEDITSSVVIPEDAV